ncbi:hypothetical protein BC939DRAFT_500552 [Gamsiella multidivaricata]|uniref:uncharacterized protein n=1 Tax=Gamsiella multidivaricata TaxID=101098 RepID=UPI00221FE9EF|nr:uncharacterized protein BC939DRAFT_500552 [Gamsiella multidivaricata]KAG0361499.1 hypothetical protein BGZ54_009082 [Gamsiella multidivaricata]KAI7828770.1 hypothetical protein BC939DRAFT_500552 [Gamsiella multidivaricata]
MSSRLERARIIDKRQTESGIEYLVSTTGEWVPSSTSRCINPELVELYEWLHNSGYREGTKVFPSTHRQVVVSARKKTQFSTTSTGLTAASISGLTPAIKIEQDVNLHMQGAGDAELTPRIKTEKDVDQIENVFQSRDIGQDKSTEPPRPKKQRLEGSYIEELDQLSIDTTEKDDVRTKSEPTSPIKSTPRGPIKKETASMDSGVPSGARTSKDSITASQDQDAVRTFNRNTEQMIEVYFKEGMDASGVEMFDILLGPYRRPTKEFVAAFFYAVILSPLTEPATIEAAIHVLDRTLTIHGPEPFTDIWDVQKRRRELADGRSSFSRQSNISGSSSSMVGSGSETGSGMSTRQNNNSSGTNNGSMVAKFLDIPPRAFHPGRLPSWNDIWDLIKTEFGLDTKPETAHHISLQEYHIHMRLQGDGAFETTRSVRRIDEEDMLKVEDGVIVTEEQEIREDIGRAIVGLLLRVLEQDAVLRNVSKTTFFYKDVMRVDLFTPGRSVRIALDVALQIIALGISPRYLEPSSSIRSSRAWPLNERCKLNSAGMEILQLGQQILLLLIRFIEAGQLSVEKGLEDLARDVISQLPKLSKIPTTRGLSRSESRSAILFLAERYSLDQMEIFLKTLIQGPCLLDSGTGSGAGVKLRKEKGEAEHQLQQNDDSDIHRYSVFDQDDYGGVLKSQTGICMGSSVFVMVLVDHWFRSKTTSKSSAGSQLSFRTVVEEYAMPNNVRPAASSTKARTAKTNVKTKNTTTKKKTRRKRRNSISSLSSLSSLSLSDDNSDDLELHLTSVGGSSKTTTDQDDGLDQWNAKDLEQVEWVVMMIEVLVWSWIEARGIRRDEIKNTGLENVLYPDGSSQQSIDENTTSGWLVMSRTLSTIGGTLKFRWDQLESIIEAAIMIEEVGLR